MPANLPSSPQGEEGEEEEGGEGDGVVASVVVLL